MTVPRPSKILPPEGLLAVAFWVNPSDARNDSQLALIHPHIKDSLLPDLYSCSGLIDESLKNLEVGALVTPD